MNPKRRASADDNRDRTLAAARDLFAQHGFENTALRDIARRAGTSCGVIFTNWRDKEALFAAAMGRPYFNDQRGSAAFELLNKISPADARQLLRSWGVEQ